MLIPLLFLLFTGCSSHNQQQIYTVTAHTISHALTYKGTIAPLQIVDVQSPADGSVQKVFFNPGALVQKNQLLLTDFLHGNQDNEVYEFLLPVYK